MNLIRSSVNTRCTILWEPVLGGKIRNIGVSLMTFEKVRKFPKSLKKRKICISQLNRICRTISSSVLSEDVTSICTNSHILKQETSHYVLTVPATSVYYASSTGL